MPRRTSRFGSDWTVAPIDPLLGIWAAVTRQTLDGKYPGGWLPEQKITVEEALRAYTEGECLRRICRADARRAAPGRPADLVLLAEDLTRISPTESIRTGRGHDHAGEGVYERSPK